MHHFGVRCSETGALDHSSQVSLATPKVYYYPQASSACDRDGCLVRGSPCQYPEETLEGYRQAALDGADYLEMDVVGDSAGIKCCDTW